MRNLLCLGVLTAMLTTPHLAFGSVITTATFGGSTYHLLDQGSWADKEAEAVSLGGHLATVSSAAENQFILDFWLPLATNFGLWIGLNDIAVDGVFVWTSGAPVTYTNWPPTEPNGGTSENAVHLHPDGAWNDNDVLASFQGVAEVSSVPEPSSLSLTAIGLALMFALKKRRSAP